MPIGAVFAIMLLLDELAIASGAYLKRWIARHRAKRRNTYMYPDHVALLTVTRIGKSVGSSALPNAPIVDDSNDRPALRIRLAAFGMRVTHLLGTGGRGPARPQAATS